MGEREGPSVRPPLRDHRGFPYRVVLHYTVYVVNEVHKELMFEAFDLSPEIMLLEFLGKPMLSYAEVHVL